MASKEQETLRDAIARNLAAVISLPSAGMLRHYKSRFLAEDPAGFWMESAAGEAPLLDQLIADHSPVGISFKSSTLKVVFASPIIRRQAEYRVNAELVLEALLLATPDVIKAVQRRSDYRVRVFDSQDLQVRIWRIPEHHILRDRPASTAELAVSVRDLSLGGMGVTARKKGDEPPKLLKDERLRIFVRFGEKEVVVEGRARFIGPLPNGDLRVGVQFAKLQTDLEGRHTLAMLTTIVGELQRDEARRARLGIAS